MDLPYQDDRNGRRIAKAKYLLRTGVRSVLKSPSSSFLPTQPDAVEFS